MILQQQMYFEDAKGDVTYLHEQIILQIMKKAHSSTGICRAG